VQIDTGGGFRSQRRTHALSDLLETRPDPAVVPDVFLACVDPGAIAANRMMREQRR
jgi:hypothetical protein